MPCCIYTYRAYCVYVIEMLWFVWDSTPSCLFLVAFLMGKYLLVLPSGTHGLTGMCPCLLLCLSLRGNVRGVYWSPLQPCYDSLHSVLADTCIAGSRMPVPVSLCHLGLRLVMSAQVLWHMDASDTIINVCQKAQTVLTKVSLQPFLIPREATKRYDVLPARSM